MPKTDINTILKKGEKTKIESIDYTTPERMKQLKKLKEKSEIALSNRWVNPYKLIRFYIKK